MAFWSGFAKGLQEYNVRETEDRRIEEERKFQKDFFWEKFNAEKDLRLREALIEGIGTGAGGSGGTPDEDGLRAVNYLTNYFGANPNLDEEEVTDFLATVKGDPSLASDIVKALETRRKDEGLDYTPEQTFELLKVYQPIISEGGADRQEIINGILNGSIDVTDPEVFSETQSSLQTPQSIPGAFRLETPLTEEVAAKQYEAYSSKVLQIADSYADPEGTPEQLRVWEALQTAGGSDKTASAIALNELSKQFGGQAVEALKATGNPLFNTIDENYLIPSFNSGQPTTQPTESESSPEMKSFSSDEEARAAARAGQLANGETILIKGRRVVVNGIPE